MSPPGDTLTITYEIRTKEQHIEALQEENRNLKQQVRDLLLLNEPGFFVDLKGVVNILHQKILLISRAEQSAFFLFDRQTEKYRLMVNRDLDDPALHELLEYIEKDPERYIAEEVPQFHIPCGFLLLPLSRRHKPLGLVGLKLTRKAPENIAELLPLLSQSAGLALDNALMYEKMLQKLLVLSNVFILGKEIIASLDIKDLIKKFLTLCCEAVDVEVAALYLFNSQVGDLEKPLILGRSKQEFEINSLSGIRTRIIEKVLTENNHVLAENLDGEEYPDEAFHFKGTRLHSALCFPVKIHTEWIGVAQLCNKTDGRFTSEDIDLLKILINQIAYVLQNSRLFIELHRAYQETAGAFAAIIDGRFHARRDHSLHVARLAESMATGLKLTPDQGRELKLAAYLHDIGLLTLPPGLLDLPRPFTPEERHQMARHVELGVEFFQRVEYLKPLAEIIRHHHERFDGTGYPAQKKGGEIPYLSRVLALLDAFEAMTHSRPHRPDPIPLKTVYDEIRREAGRQFDPEIAGLFLKMIEDGKIEI